MRNSDGHDLLENLGVVGRSGWIVGNAGEVLRVVMVGVVVNEDGVEFWFEGD
jgi:hypothetical protein